VHVHSVPIFDPADDNEGDEYEFDLVLNLKQGGGRLVVDFEGLLVYGNYESTINAINKSTRHFLCQVHPMNIVQAPGKYFSFIVDP